MFFSRAGIDQTRATFWSVTQSLLSGILTTIPPCQEDTPDLSYGPNSLNISDIIRELELGETFG